MYKYIILLLAFNSNAQLASFNLGGFSKQNTIVTTSESLTPDILWWKFLPGSGTTVNADVGVTGNLLNASQWLGGYSGSGYAITNNGTSYGLNSSSSIAYSTNKLTVTFWAIRRAATGSQMLCESSANFNNNAYTFSAYLDTSIAIAIRGEFGTNYLVKRYTLQSIDAWHHYAIIFDSSLYGGKLTYYLDGNLQTAASTPNNNLGNAFTFSTQTLYVSSRNNTTLRLNGAVDDFRIYSGELTSEQINDIKNDPQ